MLVIDEILEGIVTIMLNITAINQGLDVFEEQINIFFTLSEAFREANDSNRNLIGAIMYALLGRKTMWKLAHEAKLPTFIDDQIMQGIGRRDENREVDVGEQVQ